MQRIIPRSSRSIASFIRPTYQPPIRRHSSLLSARISGPPAQRFAAARWYSDTAEPKKDAPAEGQKASTPEVEPVEEPAEEANPSDPSKKELDAARKEIIELKDKYLRSVADFRNLQDRTKREVASARSYAITQFAKDLVDSVDNLDRALTTVPAEALQESADTNNNSDLKNLYDGLKMTETILMNTLKKHGLERTDPLGERFDPNVHEATFMTPQPGKEDGVVFHTQQKGYLLNGRVLRAAKVGVVKNS